LWQEKQKMVLIFSEFVFFNASLNRAKLPFWDIYNKMSVQQSTSFIKKQTNNLALSTKFPIFAPDFQFREQKIEKETRNNAIQNVLHNKKYQQQRQI
jgi:hypothetical protein